MTEVCDVPIVGEGGWNPRGTLNVLCAGKCERNPRLKIKWHSVGQADITFFDLDYTVPFRLQNDNVCNTTHGPELMRRMKEWASSRQGADLYSRHGYGTRVKDSNNRPVTHRDLHSKPSTVPSVFLTEQIGGVTLSEQNIEDDSDEDEPPPLNDFHDSDSEDEVDPRPRERPAGAPVAGPTSRKKRPGRKHRKQRGAAGNLGPDLPSDTGRVEAPERPVKASEIRDEKKGYHGERYLRR
jgi:hypothetical protein